MSVLFASEEEQYHTKDEDFFTYCNQIGRDAKENAVFDAR